MTLGQKKELRAAEERKVAQRLFIRRRVKHRIALFERAMLERTRRRSVGVSCSAFEHPRDTEEIA
jgi:hypothetical protein